jgi:outer membrane biosynthesis protein TonB
MKSAPLLMTVALAAIAACGGDKNKDNVAAADSLSRDLQLAPVDSSATLNDQPAAAAPAPEPAPAPAPKAAVAKPRPKPTPAPAPAAAPAPAPKPAAAPASLASGTVIRASMDDSISSRKNKAGQTVTATTVEDLKDASGRTVIP